MSATRKLRRLKQSQAVQVLPELTGKMGQVLEVGQQLAMVSAQIEEVNAKLADLDSLIANINHVQNLVRQSLEEGRAVHEEQARQRFVNLKMFNLLASQTAPHLVVDNLEQTFRDEFDATLQQGESPSQEPV